MDKNPEIKKNRFPGIQIPRLEKKPESREFAKNPEKGRWLENRENPKFPEDRDSGLGIPKKSHPEANSAQDTLMKFSSESIT